MTLARGFKAEAERIALGVRSDLGLPAWSPLSPWELAQDLEIPVLPLTELEGVDGAIAQFTEADPSEFSALTVFAGRRRLVVHNDAHSPGRQASNVAHELAHGLLLHEPRPALDALGCRDWDTTMEEEANYLGGALLVPTAAAYGIVKNRWSDAQAAARYGCSEDLLRWRLRVTGAQRLRRTG